MSSTAESKDKHNSSQFPNHQANMTTPSVSATPQTPATLQHSSGTTQPHVNRASTLILQWLTYAFWGWTILALAALVVLVFQRLIIGQDTTTSSYYVIAALIVLLPVAFICDIIYSKNEPEKKMGPYSLVMVIHAVIFALFTIGSLLFAAWSVVSIATNETDRGVHIAYLVSALVTSLFYAGTFMRTLNPAHIRWISKVYRLIMLVIVVLFIAMGFVKPTFHKIASGEKLITKGMRRPSQYLHICNTSNYTTYVSQGNPKCLGNDSFESDYDSSVPGLLYSSPCKTTSGSLRYVYISEDESCPDNTKLVFYNNLCPADAASSDECTGKYNPDIPIDNSKNNFGQNGKLEPSAVGGTQCDIPTLNDGSTTGQVAITGGATCDEAEASIQSANSKNGGNYKTNGYTCTSTKQGSNTQWSSYWSDNFYSYNCTSGSKQAAFNLQTKAQEPPNSTPIY